MERKRILIITRNFPPLTGGMERLVHHCYQELGQEFSCDVIGPEGCEDFIAPDDTVIGCKVRPLPRFLTQVAYHTWRATGKRNYALLLAGSGVTAPIAVQIARLRRTRSASLMHGLDIVADNFLYQSCFIPMARRADLVIANSRNTRRLAVDHGFEADRIQVLNPGVAVPAEIPDTEAFRAKYALGRARILLSVGRIIRRKGLVEFIDRAMPAIVSQWPDCILVVIGEPAADALKRSANLRDELRAAIARNGLEEHVRMLGRVDDWTLRAAYQSANVFVFPVVDIPGDVEGFGMVAIEAAAHGVPTVAFDTGGLADAVADGESGVLLAPGDYDAMVRAISNTIGSSDSGDWFGRCRAFAESFAWPEYGRRLRACIRDMLPAS